MATLSAFTSSDTLRNCARCGGDRVTPKRGTRCAVVTVWADDMSTLYNLNTVLFVEFTLLLHLMHIGTSGKDT